MFSVLSILYLTSYIYFVSRNSPMPTDPPKKVHLQVLLSDILLINRDMFTHFVH